MFSDDHLVYEAIIKSVNYKLGTCWVTYIGYGNEEEKNLDELMGTQEVISQEEDNYFSEVRLSSFGDVTNVTDYKCFHIFNILSFVLAGGLWISGY